MEAEPASTKSMLGEWNRRCKNVQGASDGRISGGLSEIRSGAINGKPVDRLCVVLGGRGCTWYRSTGGCLMCNYPQKCSGQVISTRELGRIVTSNFRAHIARYAPKYAVLCIYNSGSFFSDDEVPPCARREILREAAQLAQVKEIVVEARCEHVSCDRVAEAAGIVAPKRFVVGMGLESACDFARNKILLKGVHLTRFEEAAVAVQTSAELMVYVLLGIPLLSEGEAITDALASIRYARDCGARRVTLQVCSVRPHTVLEWLWARGIYRPPWLWSVNEIISKAKGETELLIAGREGTPAPLQTGWNCEICSEEIWSQFDAYNIRQDVALMQMPRCKCKQRWKNCVESRPEIPLELRLRELEKEIEKWLQGED